MAGPTVSDLMTKRLLAVGPDTGCATAARLMIENRITGAPVLDPEGYPIGVISLTDLVDPDKITAESFGFDNYYEVESGEIVAAGSGHKIDGGRVKELMTEGTVRVSALAPARTAAKLMTEKKIHRLVVMDGDRLLGMLTALDLVRALAE